MTKFAQNRAKNCYAFFFSEYLGTVLTVLTVLNYCTNCTMLNMYFLNTVPFGKI